MKNLDFCSNIINFCVVLNETAFMVNQEQEICTRENRDLFKHLSGCSIIGFC